MPFVALQEEPKSGFVPLKGEPESGFVPLEAVASKGGFIPLAEVSNPKFANFGEFAFDTAKMIGGVVPGIAEAVTQGLVGTGAALVGGGIGVGKGLVGLLAGEPFKENVIEGVKQAEEFTGKYIAPLLEPETRVGQAASKVLSLIPQGTRKVGEMVAEGTGSGEVGAVTEGALNTALLLGTQKLGRGPKPVETPVTAPIITPIAAAVKKVYQEPSAIEQLNVSTLRGRVVPNSLIEPSIPEGYVRLYRGQQGDYPSVPTEAKLGESERGRWFTTDKQAAEFYGPVRYVDIPKAVADASIEEGTLYAKTGRLIPPEWARKATIETPLAKIAQPVTSALDVAYEPLFKTDVAPNISQSIAGVAKEMLAANPELARQVRENNTRPVDFIMEQGLAKNIPPEVLARYDLSPDIFEQIYRKTQADAGRTLGYLSRVKPRMTPEEITALKELGGQVEDAAQVAPLWKRLTNIWRGSLTTQLATAMRNAETQIGRVGLDVLQAPLDATIQKVFGLPQKANPLDGLETAAALFRKNKVTTDLIFERFPAQKDRLFSTYFSDIAVKKGPVDSVLSAAEHGVQLANFINRFQEFVIRRAVFQTDLAQKTRLRGNDLEQIILNNETGKIALEDVQGAVGKALDITFSEQPKSKIGRAFVDAFNNLPGANIAIPFPRFLTQALKFNFEYNPLGILKLLSEGEKVALANGNTSVLSKALIGTTMLTAAFAFRDSQYAGEKWYEAVDSESKNVFDLRPFNPFAAYLWMADVGKRMSENTMYKMSGKDVAMGLLSTNMRAGTGLYLLDKALALFGQGGDEKKLATKLHEFSGELASGFFMPLTTFRDFYDDYTTGVSLVRDTRQEPFLGPIKSRIPVLSQTLPEAEMPTREGPKVTLHPAVRQLTGLAAASPKNSLERELDRLGFDRAEILPSTGDTDIDRQHAKNLGIISERVVVPFVDSENYKSLTDAQRGVVISEILKGIRTDVRAYVHHNLPVEKQLELALKKQPPRIRYLLREMGIK